MPVTFTVASHPAKPFSPSHRTFVHDEKDILGEIMTAYVPSKILQSSVTGNVSTRGIITQRNGFVQGTLLAYNRHHHLVIRPDDVWIAILSQLNFYINAHADELRDMFVAHTGRIELRVTSESTSVDGMNFGDLTIQMSEQIGKKVKDASLVPWVLPNFSTTTPNDAVICSVLLMSTMKKYFSYRLGTLCGIPSITLEGTKADWQSILSRLDKLHEFGEEPTEWASMLRAILTRFVRAFDVNPSTSSSTDKPFWERMIHEESGSGTYWIGGWMSAFCAWDAHGAFFADRYNDTRPSSPLCRFPTPAWVKGLEVDGKMFPRVKACPEGYAEVDVRVVDVARRKKWRCRMLAGHVGIEVVHSSFEGGDSEGNENHVQGGDTIRMAPQWFVYVKGDPGNSKRSYLPFY